MCCTSLPPPPESSVPTVTSKVDNRSGSDELSIEEASDVSNDMPHHIKENNRASNNAAPPESVAIPSDHTRKRPPSNNRTSEASAMPVDSTRTCVTACPCVTNTRVIDMHRLPQSRGIRCWEWVKGKAGLGDRFDDRLEARSKHKGNKKEYTHIIACSLADRELAGRRAVTAKRGREQHRRGRCQLLDLQP